MGSEPLTGRVLRALPPVRWLWLSLAGLGLYGIGFFGNGIGATNLIFVPAVAATLDLGFQRVRFGAVRTPDAAIATGLFLVLIFPPTAPIVFAATSAAAAVALRHLLRSRGHPWFNPASTGAILGAVLFGLAPAWWVAVGTPIGPATTGELAMLAAGGLLLARQRSTWRLPAAFFGAYAVLFAVQHLLVGATVDLKVLVLGAIDPVALFFGLFMVLEPRTAPGEARAQTLYAGIVGVAAALFPTFAPSLGLFLALLLGNGLAVALRASPREVEQAQPSSARGSPRPSRRVPRLARRASRATPLPRWPASYRIGVGFVALIAIAAVALAGGIGPSSAPVFRLSTPGSGGGINPAGCTHDNASVPASTLATLHRLLGPSVVLSYDSGTGVVVFFDPANQVTVTETDLYEDYGYAEFNGDDYAVNGCAG